MGVSRSTAIFHCCVANEPPSSKHQAIMTLESGIPNFNYHHGERCRPGAEMDFGRMSIRRPKPFTCFGAVKMTFLLRTVVLNIYATFAICL